MLIVHYSMFKSFQDTQKNVCLQFYIPLAEFDIHYFHTFVVFSAQINLRHYIG